MAYNQKQVSSGIEAMMRRNESTRPEKHILGELTGKLEDIKLNKALESDICKTPSDITSLKKSHNKYIKSCFNCVVNEKELKEKHEENMKLAIDKYINENTFNENEKEQKISELSEELEEVYDLLKIIYKKEREKNPDQKQALENAKSLYVKEMDKHFVEPKFILKHELEKLNENYKSLAHDSLKNEMKKVLPRLSYELNQSLEVIYNKYVNQNLVNIPLKPAIGIDLGTTYCCVGVINRGKVHIIDNAFGLNTTPSYISFLLNGQEIVGKDAKEIQTYENPMNTIYDVKRMIGRRFNDKEMEEDKKIWPFQVVEENGRLEVKLHKINKNFTPEELSSKILNKLKKQAEDFLGFEVNNAVITVPAYFNDSQRQATKDAGLLAGLNVLQILNEPTAAAIAYYHQIKDDFSKKVLIYDLGGGTFDVAIVSIEGKGDIDVIAVGGDTHLGGVDFDQRIFNHLSKTFEDKFSKFNSENERKRGVNRLRNKCEKVKLSLSDQISATISIDAFQVDWDFNYELTRSQFEELCMDLFKKSIEIVDKTIKKANLKPTEINDIVLIGGSTKIPKIQQLLKEYFVDKSLNKEIKPDEAVAYGATIQAALLNGEEHLNSKRTFIQDVTPFSLGIEVLDKSMFVLIPSNSKIPISKKQIFTTSHDDQTETGIYIFEGDNEVARQNRLLGEFIISGYPKKPAGEVEIEVTMEINNEGILYVKAESSGKSEGITIKDNRGRLSDEEIQKLIIS